MTLALIAVSCATSSAFAMVPEIVCGCTGDACGSVFLRTKVIPGEKTSILITKRNLGEPTDPDAADYETALPTAVYRAGLKENRLDIPLTTATTDYFGGAIYNIRGELLIRPKGEYSTLIETLANGLLISTQLKCFE